MRDNSNKLLKKLMVLFAGIIAVFSVTSCTKSFCTNQDNANQAFNVYGNIYNQTQEIDENYSDDFDYIQGDKNREILIKKQNQNRNTLFSSLTAAQGYTSMYELVDENGVNTFLTFMNDKAIKFKDDNFTYWMNGTLDEIKDEKQAKAIAWHVGIYAGLEKNEQGKVSKVAPIYTNMEAWYSEAVTTLGVLKCPSSGFITAMKKTIDTSYKNNTAAITPESMLLTNQNGGSIYVERKTWGQAFKEYGFLEGLFVYPLSCITHYIVKGLGYTGGAAILGILVVTLLVRSLTVVSSIVQGKSQAKQAKIQPLLNELQKKYPNNQTDKEERQAFAMEQAQLMKKNKVHPMLPMLFMLLQFPLFICVWSALQGSAVLADSTFLGLSFTTRVSECFKAGTPGAAVGIVIFITMSIANILSTMTSMAFNNWRMKNFNPAPIQRDANGNVQDPTKMTKIMSYVMMAFVVFMGYSLPTGMGIYWLIGALMSIIQTLITEAIQMKSRHDASKNIGDGTNLAAIRRSNKHIGQDNKKNKANKPMWR